jgi:hypothetical protein
MFPKKDESGPLTFSVTGNLRWVDPENGAPNKDAVKKSNDEAVKNWGVIIETCDRIKRKTAELSLVTRDALMVRWAILGSHGDLIQVLRKAWDPNSEYGKAVSKVEARFPERASHCWSKKDEDDLSDIETKANTRFEL